MIELNSAPGWSRIYGMTILDPSGFGERTGQSPFLADLVDETTFYKSMWKSCFKVNDMHAWSSRVDKIDNKLAGGTEPPARPTEPVLSIRISKFLLPRISIKHRNQNQGRKVNVSV